MCSCTSGCVHLHMQDTPEAHKNLPVLVQNVADRLTSFVVGYNDTGRTPVVQPQLSVMLHRCSVRHTHAHAHSHTGRLMMSLLVFLESATILAEAGG